MRIVDGNEPTRMEPRQAFMGCMMLCIGASMLIAAVALMVYVVKL